MLFLDMNDIYVPVLFVDMNDLMIYMFVGLDALLTIYV